MMTDHPGPLLNTMLGFSLLLATVVHASADKLSLPEVDLSQVSVEFKVKVLGVLPVTGQFRDVRGSIADPEPNAGSGLTITICPYSLDTRNAERDRLLRSPLFFDVERFPAIHFNDVVVVTSNGGERFLTGTLTLHGVSQTIVFRLKDLGSADSGNAPRAYKAKATINRSAFGLDAFPLVVGDEVEITVHVHGELTGLPERFQRISAGNRRVSAWAH